MEIGEFAKQFERMVFCQVGSKALPYIRSLSGTFDASVGMSGGLSSHENPQFRIICAKEGAKVSATLRLPTATAKPEWLKGKDTIGFKVLALPDVEKGG